jgi:hypothetical protein
MSKQPKKPAGSYEVGYGKPPVATQFKKGQSGNPKGRRKRTPQAEIEELFMKEYLRPVKVREGDRVQTMPAIQVIIRAEINKGVKGSGPSQRSVLRSARQIERDWRARPRPCFKPRSSSRSRPNASAPGRSRRAVLLMRLCWIQRPSRSISPQGT